MPKLAYSSKRFGAESLEVIAWANEIMEDYAGQGYDLTLRQLYYQGVARALIPNSDRSYKRLGSIVNDARMSGLIDWNHIVDRTRNLKSVGHWRDPAHIIGATASSFKVARWDDQETYVECWIEKDALVGVIAGICSELDVPYFSCRGYTSQSEMWGAGRRLLTKVLDGKHVTILHLGDHDPSGIDMTRDITDRLRLFIASDYLRAIAKRDGVRPNEMSQPNIDVTIKDALDRFTVKRIALTRDQVDEYNPPPNPAKLTDSRAGVRRDGSVAEGSYVDLHGYESWELDALDPATLTALVREHVEEEIDWDAWLESSKRQRRGQLLLERASRDWAKIEATLDEPDVDYEDDDE